MVRPVGFFVSEVMTTTTPDLITLTTEEGHEVQLSARDLATLKAWPRLDMTRLTVVGADAVHARRTDGTIHPQSLEDLLALVTVPAVTKAPPAAPADPLTCFLAPGLPKPPTAPGAMLDHFLTTGNTSKPGSGSRKLLPTVLVDGVPVLQKGNTFEGSRVKLPVTAEGSRDVVAWAYLPRSAFQRLRCAPSRPDSLVWRMGADGQPVTRVRNGRGTPVPVAVADLMGHIGLNVKDLDVQAVR
jgi:hypothetical protein